MSPLLVPQMQRAIPSQRVMNLPLTQDLYHVLEGRILQMAQKIATVSPNRVTAFKNQNRVSCSKIEPVP